MKGLATTGQGTYVFAPSELRGSRYTNFQPNLLRSSQGINLKSCSTRKALNPPIGIWKTRLKLGCVQVTNEDELNPCRTIAQNARNLLSAVAGLPSLVRNRQTEWPTVT